MESFLRKILRYTLRPFCKHKIIIVEYSVKQKYIHTSSWGNGGKFKLVYNIYQQNKCKFCGKFIGFKHTIRKHLTKYQCECFFRKLENGK